MSTKRSAGTGVPAQKTTYSAATRKKDRSPNLCAFADGRQCRTPRCSGHLHLCYFHAQKEAESLAVQQVGQDISRFLPTKLLTACDLGVAMSRLFCAVAQGQIKPKVASTLAYLAQTMLQSIPIAKHEYIESFDPDTWRSTVRSSFRHDDPDDADGTADDTADDPADAPAPQPFHKPPASSAPAPTAKPASPPAPQPPVNCHSEPAARREEPASSSSSPSPTPASVPSISPVCHPERSEGSASSSNSSLATHHSPLPPATSLHTPLPLTSTEFAQQVLAGLPRSLRSDPVGPTGSLSATPHVQPAPPNPQPAATPAGCHSKPAARREEPASSSNSSLATHHSPLPQPAPPPLPPNFGAPANWDVLIPPKPRRRFSRHWHLLE